MENTKRDLSLDFTKPRHPRAGQPAPSLVTPILNLSTPEINKMISGDELAVLTPNGISSIIPQSSVLPSPLIPTTVNSNQVTTFNNNSNGTISSNNNNISPNINSLENQTNHHSNNQHKRSDRSKDQDLEKIEKKRERNRLAAKKCRQRKLETIEQLRKHVSELEHKNQQLEMDFEKFKNIRNSQIEHLQRENDELKRLLARSQ